MKEIVDEIIGNEKLLGAVGGSAVLDGLKLCAFMFAVGILLTIKRF